MWRTKAEGFRKQTAEEDGPAQRVGESKVGMETIV